MRLPTLMMLLIAILLTVIVMQNSGDIPMKLLFTETYVSKGSAFLLFAAGGFIIGFVIRGPRRQSRVEDFDHHEDTDAPPRGQHLSDEDREYIS